MFGSIFSMFKRLFRESKIAELKLMMSTFRSRLVKSFQVAPAELEGVIRTFPSMKIGIPHERYGEVPRAYVVVRKDHKFRIDDLEKYVHAKVAKFKHLIGGISVIDAIAKNPSGKILRRELKRAYQEKSI